jgi:hypothetical protein
MSLSEHNVRAAMRRMKEPQEPHDAAVPAEWRRANAMIAAAMRASLAQQRTVGRKPVPPPRGQSAP